MKTNNRWAIAEDEIKHISLGLVLAAGVILTQPAMASYPAPVDLGSCSTFAILAGSTTTTTGGGIINGDVGLSPAGSQGIPLAQINGTIYNGGPIAAQAQVDLTAAFNDAAGRAVGRITKAGNIGGQTLAPGLYWSASSLQITGDLTLDAGGDPNAVWIFQIGSTLTTAAGGDSRVILTGSAQAKNIFWQVGSSATLGTYSVFKGTIMAQESITMDIDSIMDGRALARVGAVTFNGSSGSLPLNNQAIVNFIPTNGSVFAGTNKIGLSAQASSGLPVTFARISGPGAITGGTNLAFVSTGLVLIVASQAGNTSYEPAPNVTNTFTVIPPLPVEPGWLAIQVTPAGGSWQLTGPAGYAGPTAGTGNLAAVSVFVGEYGIAYGVLSGYVAPTNQTQFVVAGVTSLFEGAYRQVSTNIAPPVVTATEGIYTNKVQISWPKVSGVIGYEIWKSQTNDVNTAVRIVEVPDNGAAIFLYNDYAVVPVRSYYYWGLAKTATLLSTMSIVCMGYASLAPDPNAPRADLVASDMVYLPVNAANLTTAGTVSFRLGNLGPATLNSAEVAFDFRISFDNTTMVMLGSDQRAFSLAPGQEQLVILTAQAKLGLVIPVIISGVKQVQVTVRHASPLIDPNLANNTTTAAGTVLVRAAGVNSPDRSLNDYDGDGKSDGCIYQSAWGRWYMKFSGDRYVALEIMGDIGPGQTPVPGDYDGDGITDVAVYGRSSGWWQALLSSSEQIIVGQFGGPDFAAVQCDFDGDSMTDPLVYREANGYLAGLASSRQYAFYDGIFGGMGYETVMADYDGDRLADLAVYNRTTGLWMIRISGSGQVLTGTFGGSDYLPVSADYDGDGLADPAIYAPGTAYWQVMLSGSLTTQGHYTWVDGYLGGIGGTPVPADYDGDGRADPAVYNRVTSLWELFLSNQGYQTVSGFFGGPAYQPVLE